MKHIIILAILFLSFPLVWGQTTRVVLRSACKDKELVNLSTFHLGQTKFLVWKNIEPGESYDQVIKITEKKFYTLIFRSIQYDLFLEPGKEVEIDFQPDGKIVLKGAYEKLNNLLVQIRQEYPSKDKYAGQLLAGKEADLNQERYDFYAARYQEQLKMVKKASLYKQEKELAAGYVQAVFLKNIYKPVVDSKVFGKSNKAEITPGYAFEMTKMKLEPAIIYYTDWAEYLKELMYTKMQAGELKLNNPELWISEWGKAISSPLLREHFIGYLIEGEVRMRYFDTACAERCEMAGKMVTDSVILRKIDANIAKIESVREAPDVSLVTFENTKGERVSLGDFKGKYMFIDIWSTYCNPCIGEMPYLHELEKQLEGAPIEFVSISLDRNRESWKKFLVEHQMQNNQFIMLDGEKNPLWSLIGLSGIPRFVLVSPDSKVIKKNTYRPSNPILGCQLKAIIKPVGE